MSLAAGQQQRPVAIATMIADVIMGGTAREVSDRRPPVRVTQLMVPGNEAPSPEGRD
jgi:hypothetical protein